MIDTSRFNQREKILGLSTAILIASVVFYVGMLEPQIKQHRALQKDLHNLQIRYTKMQTDVLMRDRINHAYEQVQHLIASTETEQQQISILTRELSDIYSNQDVKIKSVKILPSLKEPHYTQLTIKAELTGNVRNFIKLIGSLEVLNKPIRIDSFELRAQEATDMIHASLIITKIVKVSKE